MTAASSAILVIDDNPENLRVAVDVLEADGHTVRTARSGATGLKRAAAISPALILLDIEMPELDGYETCRRLKEDPDLREIPVVFMTARVEVSDKVRAFEVGAVDYVTKPFEVHELLARVRTHLKVHALQEAVQQRNRQLEELNATLRDRVDEQVGELVARARQVETLNAQLRKQVQDRSDALALTLSRLARRSTNSDDELVGVMLDGRYSIERLIGLGGMGAVYAGRDRHTEEEVAIKVIRSSNPRSEPLLRFIREARIAAAVDHPGVVKMLHIDVHDDGMLFQVQELVVGETLSLCLGRHQQFATGPGARLLATLAEALCSAHAVGVFHRDLKPSNIIMTQSAPGLKIVDFGIAKKDTLLDDDEKTASGAGRFDAPTIPGEVVGTPRFMSPEQRRGESGVGAPTDVYSMGILAYLAWTGDVPTDDEPESIPSDVAAIVRACLDDEPENRPHARELYDAFGALADRLEAPTLHELVSADAFL